MDGQEVGISVRGETSVTISGLTADYLYSIQVVAVNAQGFQVASQAVYVRTRPKSDNDDDEPDDHEPRVQSHSPVLDIPSPAHRAPKKRNSVDALKTRETSTTNDDSKRSDSKELIEDLTLRMDGIRKETAGLDAQLSQMAEHQLQEETAYLKKLEDLRTKKKEEDDAKNAKDQHHKHLDQQKREIETKRNQALRALKTEQDAHQKQATDITSFISSTQNSIETVEHLQESMKNLTAETDEAVQDAERTGQIAAEELSEIESEIRYLLSRKADSEAELSKLLAESRVPSPTAQEIEEAARNDNLWKEREDSLARQYDDIHQKFMRLSSNVYNLQEASNLSTPGSDQGPEHTAQMRRRVSRRGRPDDIGRPDSASRGSAFPTFNPDAAPFVASSPMYSSKDSTSAMPSQSSKSIFSPNDSYNTLPPVVFPTQIDNLGYAVPRTNYQGSSIVGTSSIFVDEPAHPRIASPFTRRESPKSSQSGSNPPSPAVQTRGALPSIFNATPGIVQRNSSGSLVASLNGTPLIETDDKKDPNWFWPIKKKATNDPLALDRTNARSLPKADVAPIGTRRNRSGSLLEENAARSSAPPTSVGYHDLDLINVIGHPLSREASVEKDGYSTSAFPLPRPSNGRAFGWESPRVPPLQRHLPNLWNSTDSDQAAASVRTFDPFGDLPKHNNAQLTSLNQDFLTPPTTYHTTIDASKLSNLNREISNGSRKSNKSKADSHESKDKTKRLGDNSKFSSFVGRMFSIKKEEKDEADPASGMDDFESNEITSE